MMGRIEELVESLARDDAVVHLAPHPYWLSAQWLAAAVVYIALALLISGLRPDLMAKLGEPWFLLEIVFLGGILLASSLSASLLAFPDLHQKRKAALAPVVILGLFALVLFFSWQADNPPAPLPLHSYQCAGSITLLALLPAGWIIYSIHKYASTHTALAGSIALLYAFSVGALWLRLSERNDSLIHVVEWHYLPLLAFSALGLWLGKRLLKW